MITENKKSLKSPCSELRKELKQHPNINVASVDGNVLSTILNAKLDFLKRKKIEEPLDSFIETLIPSDRSFYNALACGKTRFILECKKASPSKGLIRADFNPVEIGKIYNNYAAAISVLADEDFFSGKYEYIAEVKKNVQVPILCKDFIYDTYQIYLARKNNADAVLLMLSVLTDEAYIELSNIAHSLNMGILTEASTSEEIERAIKLGAKIIGINNRNLRNLSVDLNNVRILSKLVPDDRIVISESGIYTHDQVLELSQYAKGFLVGSSLTAEEDIEKACKKLILGENKVCGITRVEDAISSFQAGAIYNGLIFAKKSPRYIEPTVAKHLVASSRRAGCNQDFVGVFVNENIDTIVDIVNFVKLAVVQLHGDENHDYVKELRSKLPKTIAIWKAIPIIDSYPLDAINDFLPLVSRILIDPKNNNGFGGTGTTFKWSLCAPEHKNKLIIAGGLTPQNIEQARIESCAIGYDINSGVEVTPGIKDSNKIHQVFCKLEDF
ncbi:MAG: bifunctional indole-3-glycerol-phosphate synthase TrpC/phosphoribosylanthranilate isomerase TrpF [Succinivibrionaceae bacterium]